MAISLGSGIDVGISSAKGHAAACQATIRCHTMCSSAGEGAVPAARAGGQGGCQGVLHAFGFNQSKFGQFCKARSFLPCVVELPCPALPPPAAQQPPEDGSGETGDDGYASVGGTSPASMRAWLRHMREFTYQVGVGGTHGTQAPWLLSMGAVLGCSGLASACLRRLHFRLELLAWHPAFCSAQTVGLLPTHCPPAMDSPALAAAYAQSGFAYIEVRGAGGWLAGRHGSPFVELRCHGLS